MIVAKFGGTSVSTKKNIQTICEIAKKEMVRKPVIVVSAISKVTDALLMAANTKGKNRKTAISFVRKTHEDLIHDLFERKVSNDMLGYIAVCIQKIEKILETKELSKQQQDTLVSYGEIMSSYIIACTLCRESIRSSQVLGTDIIVTNDDFGSAEFLPLETEKNVQKHLLPIVEKGIVPVITGFIGATQHGETTTLGRGGSDYSASIIGCCLHAEEIQFWKDVDGIYTADPRKIKDAKLLHVISYQEASALAMQGAKVLHPRAILPVISESIPIRVLNTFHPECIGTLIKNKREIFL